jgi:hypothetical protein
MTQDQLTAEAQASTTVSSSNASKSSEAQVLDFTGTVQSYNALQGSTTKILIIKAIVGDETKSFLINKPLQSWNGFVDLVEGSDFTISYENRIAGVTTWSNKSGESGVHTASGTNVTKCTKAFKKETGMKILESKMMEIFAKSEGNVELTGALGQAFAAFLK